MTNRILSLLFIASVFVACSKQTQESTKQEQPSQKTFSQVPISALDPNKMVPVGMCRIVGTIISIEAAMASNDANDPCSKAPCVAVVRIDSILGCGSGVQQGVSEGSSARVRFASTLAPTKDMFPSINPPLPGLQKGSKFKALIQASAETAIYSIDKYEIQ